MCISITSLDLWNNSTRKKQAPLYQQPNFEGKLTVAQVKKFPLEKKLSYMFDGITSSDLIAVGKNVEEVKVGIVKAIEEFGNIIKRVLFIKHGGIAVPMAFGMQEEDSITCTNIGNKDILITTGDEADTVEPNDTYFIDLYGAVKTGCLNHRMSVGVGLHDFSSGRHGGWDVLDTASGCVDSTSINVGYELSRDYVVDTRTTFTPFMMVNYSFSHYDALHEQVGSYSFESDFDDQNLLQVGLGARVAYKFNVMSDWEDTTLTSSLAAVVEFSEHKVKGTHRFDDEAFGVSSMKREPFYGQLGFDLSMPMASQWEMQAGVYGRLGPDRGGVAGNVGLKYDF